jgi:hypothetical protein
MRRRHHRRHYSRENPLTQTELIIGALVGVSVLGIGGYLLYQHYNPSTASASASGATSPGGIQSISTDSSGNLLINGYPVAQSQPTAAAGS